MPTQARKTPRQARSRATVDALLEATTRVLAEQGYERTTTNRIAQVAGVSVGSLYQYFPNKDAIITGLVDRHVERLRRLFAETLLGVADAPLEVAAGALVHAVVAIHRAHPALNRVVLEQVPRMGLTHTVDAFDDFAVQLIAGYMRRRADELRPKNLELAAWVLMRTLQPLVHAAVRQGPERFDDPEFLAETTALIVGYLRR